VFHSGGRIFRCVFPHAAGDIQAFLASPLAAQWMAGGTLARTGIPESASSAGIPAERRNGFPPGSLIVEHAPIPFGNYPYEWAPAMLHRAAALTLEMAGAAMRAGFALKDANPYNVMFDGAQPVFLDVLSFRRRDPLESMWRPHAQFIRTFVYPLLACRYFGLRPDEILLAHRDGLEPERMLALCPMYRALAPPFLSSVTVPVLLARRGHDGRADRYRVRHAQDANEAAFILERLFAQAGRLLESASIRRPNGGAPQYMASGQNYAPEERARKERLIISAFNRWPPKNVLDIGCNTGHFSLLAARSGARVVAIDRDADAVDALWQSASGAGARILPLVVDIGRPPGACGWHNSECAAFLDRARGAFDCVLMLALIHHLLVNERVPMEAILQLAAELTTRLAFVEYIDPGDLLFRRIVRGREALHRGVTRENFEAAAGRWFQILEVHDVTPARRIYILRKREA